MNDMTGAIIPKSDQLNSDDLIGGPRSIKITEVTIQGGQEQPVAINFDGDNGKPWKPCKSMSRVLVAAWGPDAKQYIGRRLTLYRDPTVKWGGMEVGGIRISHMSDLDAVMTMALTATKGSRKPFTVKPLLPETKPAPKSDIAPNPELVTYFKDQFTGAQTLGSLAKEWAAAQKRWGEMNAADQASVTAAKDARKVELTPKVEGGDE